MYHRCDIKVYFLVLDEADNTAPVSDSVAPTS